MVCFALFSVCFNLLGCTGTDKSLSFFYQSDGKGLVNVQVFALVKDRIMLKCEFFKDLKDLGIFPSMLRSLSVSSMRTMNFSSLCLAVI
jgi:hypothetical protein